jgi:hypothetical protein
VEFKKVDLIDVEISMVVTRDQGEQGERKDGRD